MSTLREDVLPIVDDGRSLIEELGFRTHSLTIRTRTWSGTEDLGASVGVGDYSDDDVTITPRPKVVETSERELLVGPITPSHATGGYSPAQLNPQTEIDETSQEVLYVVSGPGGTHAYSLLSIDDKKAFGYSLRLRLIDRAVPL